MFHAKSAVGIELSQFVIHRSHLWLRAFYALAEWISSVGWFPGGGYAVAVFAGGVRTKGRVAVVKGAAYRSAVFGDIIIFSGIGLLPLICNSNAGQIAFSRFEQSFSPFGYGK
jgi:hypothetical protein